MVETRRLLVEMSGLLVGFSEQVLMMEIGGEITEENRQKYNPMKSFILATGMIGLCFFQSFGQDNHLGSDTTKNATIQLLRNGKFSFKNLDPTPIEKHVIGLGYGYTTEFRSALATNPYAVRELRKSYQYQAMETGGRVIFYTLLVKSFIYTIKKAKQVRSGDFSGNPTPVVDAVNLTVSAGISFYGTIKKRKQMKKAVHVFNGDFTNIK